MVQPVLRDEADSRRHDSVFAEREEELNNSKMPPVLKGRFPYVMEKATGYIHPWSKDLAARSDLVIGCYNLEGSLDPADAVVDYDPQGVAMREQRGLRVATVPPEDAATRKAADAAKRKQLRQQEEDRLRQEVLQEMADEGETPEEMKARLRAEVEAQVRDELKVELKQELTETAPVVEVSVPAVETTENPAPTLTKAQQKAADAKAAKAAKETVEPVKVEQTASVPEQAGSDANSTQAELDAEFDKVMKGE